MCRFRGLSWVLLAALVFVADQALKQWMLSHLQWGEPQAITSFFNLTLAYNQGAAFSFLHDAAGWQNIIFCTLAFIATLFILRWLYQHPSREFRWPNISLSLIMGGALGNVYDRLTYGYVIDFIDFHWHDWHFAIFNFADSAICVGAFLMMWYWSRMSKE